MIVNQLLETCGNNLVDKSARRKKEYIWGNNAPFMN